MMIESRITPLCKTTLIVDAKKPNTISYMKCFLKKITLFLAAVFAPCQLMADNTVLINFGSMSDSFDSATGWNHAAGSHPHANIFKRDTASLNDTEGKQSDLSVSMKMTGVPMLEGIANNSIDPAPTTPSSSLDQLWKNAHGENLPDSAYVGHWAAGGVLEVATTTSVEVSGLKANSSYTITGGFTVGGLAHVAADNVPISLGKMEDNPGITLTNVYLINGDGLVIDLLHIGDFSLAEVLQFDTFTVSWQFETGAQADSILFEFAPSVADLATADELRFMAITEHTGMTTPPDITGDITVVAPVVPEPATATLSLLALVGLAARRRR